MGWRRTAGLATINRRLVLGVSAVGEEQLGAVGLRCADRYHREYWRVRWLSSIVSEWSVGDEKCAYKW